MGEALTALALTFGDFAFGVLGCGWAGIGN